MKYNFKFLIDPEKFRDKSALATISPKIDMAKDDEDMLSELFIKLDRQNHIQNLSGIFSKAGLNILFPYPISLIQFLQICNYNHIQNPQILRLYEASNDILQQDKYTIDIIQQKYYNFVKTLQKKHSDRLAAEQKDIEKHCKAVLEKEKQHYQEKSKKNKSQRYLEILKEIELELKSL